MSNVRCPGQDQRYWTPEDIFDIKCPFCAHEIEFFKDEPFLLCPGCKEEVRNPRIDLGCAKWCKYAEECLGKAIVEESDIGTASMCDQLIAEMKKLFGDDQQRIDHALKVLDYAGKISEVELQGDPLVIKAAAILHDIGIHNAERKHNSSDGRFQELEGPPIARNIMIKLGIEEDLIEHVCRIVGSHHTADAVDTPEFRTIWDADWLVNIPAKCNGYSQDKLTRFIDKIFKTARGKELAYNFFLTDVT